MIHGLYWCVARTAPGLTSGSFVVVVFVVVVVLLLLSLFCSITTSVAKVASEPPFHTAFRLLKRRKLLVNNFERF